MKNGITTLVVFVAMEYLAILFKIGILEDFNILVRPQLLLLLLPYVVAFGVIELTTRRSTARTKIVCTGTVGLLVLALLFGTSYTTTDGIARGNWQFLAVLATIPFIIYMVVTYATSERGHGTNEGTPNQAL